jgi:Spy/CpxP family protein refolding chaperone
MKKRNIQNIIILGIAILPAVAWGLTPGEGRRLGPPPEAFAVCQGRMSGDAVQFSNRRGVMVEATCREVDGKLVGMADGHPGAGPGRWGDMAGGHQLQRLVGDLALSEGQQAQVRAILEAERQQTAALQANVRQGRDGLRTAIHSGTADGAAIRDQVAAQAQDQADVLVARAQSWQQIRDLLTDEQQAALTEDSGMTRGRCGQGKGPGECCQQGGGKRW